MQCNIVYITQRTEVGKIILIGNISDKDYKSHHNNNGKSVFKSKCNSLQVFSVQCKSIRYGKVGINSVQVESSQY